MQYQEIVHQLHERYRLVVTGCVGDGWMDDLRFYVLFNSITVISGRCLDDNERLCAMELRLRMRRFHLE